MTTENARWQDERVQSILGKRTLEAYAPPLRSYLFPGAGVLDVGCGPGSITLGVANEVCPGSAVGVDLARNAIRHALSLAEQTETENVRFEVGDARSLQFEAQTFDLTYCINLLHLLDAPARALEEHRRVTKRGGWVVAVLGGGEAVCYPEFPAGQKVGAALAKLNRPGECTCSPKRPLGPRALALLSDAGLEELKVEGFVPPMLCVYAGSEYFDHQYRQLVPQERRH